MTASPSLYSFGHPHFLCAPPRSLDCACLVLVCCFRPIINMKASHSILTAWSSKGLSQYCHPHGQEVSARTLQCPRLFPISTIHANVRMHRLGSPHFLLVVPRLVLSRLSLLFWSRLMLNSVVANLALPRHKQSAAFCQTSTEQAERGQNTQREGPPPQRQSNRMGQNGVSCAA